MKNIHKYNCSVNATLLMKQCLQWRTLALLLCTLLLIEGQTYAQKTQPVPGKGGTVAGFEVDAHFQSGSIPNFWSSGNYKNFGSTGDDWTGTNGVLLKSGTKYIAGYTEDRQTVWKIDGNSGSKSSYAEVDMFNGTSNKNSDFIAAGQSPWSLKVSDGGPQKNDITNVYLHVRTVGGHKWLFFAFETRSTDGTSYADIEYNQAGLSFPTPGQSGSIIGLGTKELGGRSIGDFILSVDFSGGGTNPKIAARKIKSDGTWTDAMNIDANAFLTVNIADVPAVVAGGGFNGDGSASSTTYAFQLMEGGVNLTLAGLEPDACAPTSTVMFKTRSSDSFTAELKDLSILPFTITPPAIVAATGDEECVKGTAVLEANGKGDGAESATFKWYKPNGDEITSGGRYTIVTSSTGTGLLSSKLTIENLEEADGGAYKAAMVGATCDGDPALAQLKVNPNPTASVDPMTAQCKNEEGSNVFTLNGSYANGTAKWTVSGGTLSDESYVDGVASAKLTVSAVGTYTATLTTTSSFNPSCGNKADAEPAVVNPNPDPSTGTAKTCVNEPKQIGPTPVAGFSYSWSPTTGLSDPNIANPTVTMASAGIFTYTLTITNVSTRCLSAGNWEITVENCGVLAGCTPGYWKQSQHFGNWGCGYTPDTKLFGAGGAFPDVTYEKSWNKKWGLTSSTTMLEALSAEEKTEEVNNGGFARVARHATAGLLNACALTGDYRYTFTMDEVRIMATGAFKSGVLTDDTSLEQDFLNWTMGINTFDAKSVGDALERANEIGCPLGNSKTNARTSSEIEAETSSLDSKLSVSVFPNPVRDFSTVRFSSPVETKAILQVFSMDGKQVSVLFDGAMEAGKVYEAQLQLKQAGSAMYFYILQTDHGRSTGKILSAQ